MCYHNAEEQQLFPSGKVTEVLSQTIRSRSFYSEENYSQVEKYSRQLPEPELCSDAALQT